MFLYHFTCLTHLESILRDGRLTTTDSQLSQTRRDVGPGVVWLTDRDDVAATLPVLGGLMRGPQGIRPMEAWAMPYEAQKTRVRFTIDMDRDNPDLGWWPKWARENGIKESWYRLIAEVGEPSNPKNWFVVTRPISLDEVRLIEVRTREDAGFRPYTSGVWAPAP